MGRGGYTEGAARTLQRAAGRPQLRPAGAEGSSAGKPAVSEEAGAWAHCQ